MPGRTLLVALWAWVSVTGVADAQPRWITDVDAAALDQSRAPVSLQFRRELDLGSRPRSFIVHVSADNRFVLFVNGERIGAGPARGDLLHWRYETFDIAAALKRGRNVIAAQVWNDGRAASLAQVSSGRTGFWLRAQDESQASLVQSGPAWRVRIDRSRTIEAGRQQIARAVGAGFYAAGPAGTFDADLQSTDWKAAGTATAGWRSAVLVDSGEAGPWSLVPDQLPQMRLERVPSGRQVRATGVQGGVSRRRRSRYRRAPRQQSSSMQVVSWRTRWCWRPAVPAQKSASPTRRRCTSRLPKAVTAGARCQSVWPIAQRLATVWRWD